MTSNIGSSLIRESFEKMNPGNREEILESTKNKVFELLKQTIRPEFLNRIDELIMFTPLNQSEIQQIVQLQLNHIIRQLEDSGVKLEVSERAIKWIALMGFDPQFGARPVKRVLQRHLLNELSKQLIAQSIDKTKPIVVDEKEDRLIFGNE
jgi:ATP-dependent Clp protease ATP-binding subunit ClpB